MTTIPRDIAEILHGAQSPAVLCSFGSDSTLLLHYARQVQSGIPIYYFGDDLPELARQLVIDDDVPVFSFAPADRYLLRCDDKLSLIDEYSFNGERVPMVSKVKRLQTINAKTDMQQDGLRRTAAQPEDEAVLSRAPRGIHEDLAADASVDAGAATKGQRAQQGRGLQAAGVTGAASLRELWNDREGGNAPPRLRLPVDSGVAVPTVPSTRTQSAESKNCTGHSKTWVATPDFHFPHDVILWGYKARDRCDVLGERQFEREIRLGHTKFIAPLYDLSDDEVLDRLATLGLTYTTDDEASFCDTCLNAIINSDWDDTAALAGFPSRYYYNH